eukprot:326226-Chlamydomonas_euryale.AAC.1
MPPKPAAPCELPVGMIHLWHVVRAERRARDGRQHLGQTSQQHDDAAGLAPQRCARAGQPRGAGARSSARSPPAQQIDRCSRQRTGRGDADGTCDGGSRDAGPRALGGLGMRAPRPAQEPGQTRGRARWGRRCEMTAAAVPSLNLCTSPSWLLGRSHFWRCGRSESLPAPTCASPTTLHGSAAPPSLLACTRLLLAERLRTRSLERALWPPEPAAGLYGVFPARTLPDQPWASSTATEAPARPPRPNCPGQRRGGRSRGLEGSPRPATSRRNSTSDVIETDPNNRQLILEAVTSRSLPDSLT